MAIPYGGLAAELSDTHCLTLFICPMNTTLNPPSPPAGKGVAHSTVLNLLGQALPLLLGFFAIPVVVREAGVDRFGVITLAWMVIGYFGLFDLGLGRALTQLLSSKIGVVSESELSRMSWTALWVMLVMGVVGGAIAFVLSPMLSEKIFKMPAHLRPEALTAFYILSAAVPIIVLSSGFVGILAAYRRFDYINYVRVPLGMVSFGSPLLVLPFTRSLVPIVLVLAVSRLVAAVVQYILCVKVMPSLGGTKRFETTMAKPLLSFGWWMTISNIISPLMVYLDRFIIGAMLSVTAVAYYTTPYEVITRLWIFPGSLVAVLFPAFAASNADFDSSRTIKLLSKGIAATFILLFPIVLVVTTYSKEGLSLWLGLDFAENSAPVLKWLAAGVFMNCLAQIVFALIQGRGRPDLTAKFHLVEFCIYLPLLLWAISAHGIAGAAAAWALRVSLDGVMLLWATQRLIPALRVYTVRVLGYMVASAALFYLCSYPDSLLLRSGMLFVVMAVFSVAALLYMRRSRILASFRSGAE